MSTYAKFETEIAVQPDDLGRDGQVRPARYLDYVLRARLEQGGRCYKMPIEAFTARGLGWFMVSAEIRFLLPLEVDDRVVVRTWMESFSKTGCGVAFELERRGDATRVSEGRCYYTLVTLADGRATPLPDDVKAIYSI